MANPSRDPVPWHRWIRDLPTLVRGALRTARAPARLKPGQRWRWREMTAWRFLTAPLRVLPDFVVIGTHRGGTTSLYRNLILHPQIESCIRKEVHFFDQYHGEGPYWYRGHFPTRSEMRQRAREVGGPVITGEATPRYLVDPESRVRMAELLPDAKLIVLLREPVARAYSNYQVLVANHAETRSFEELLAGDRTWLADDPVELLRRRVSASITFPKGSMIGAGLYAYQLEHIFELFPREQVLVEASENLYTDEKAFYGRVLDFLGVETFEPESFVAMRPPAYPQISTETRAQLEAFFRPHNEHLFELLGRRLEWDEGQHTGSSNEGG